MEQINIHHLPTKGGKRKNFRHYENKPSLKGVEPKSYNDGMILIVVHQIEGRGRVVLLCLFHDLLSLSKKKK